MDREFIASELLNVAKNIIAKDIVGNKGDKIKSNLKFDRQNFVSRRGYLEYHIDPTIGRNGKPIFDVFGGKLVGRFTTPGLKPLKGRFITFLIKNFTVDEYFNRLSKGEKWLDVAKSKGFNSELTKKQQQKLRGD
jgi:hypothetical protein